MSPATEAAILSLLSETRNPHHIQAKVAGATLADVRRLMRLNPSELEGWGKPNLQPFIISRRRTAHWPHEDQPVIMQHRRLHDQGRVTMCQGRDAEWIIQYAIPVQKPNPRSPYFYGGGTC